jgi:hypothetical protein
VALTDGFGLTLPRCNLVSLGGCQSVLLFDLALSKFSSLLLRGEGMPTAGLCSGELLLALPLEHPKMVKLAGRWVRLGHKREPRL